MDSGDRLDYKILKLDNTRYTMTYDKKVYGPQSFGGATTYVAISGLEIYGLLVVTSAAPNKFSGNITYVKRKYRRHDIAWALWERFLHTHAGIQCIELCILSRNGKRLADKLKRFYGGIEWDVYQCL